jgi:hypothetical protein
MKSLFSLGRMGVRVAVEDWARSSHWDRRISYSNRNVGDRDADNIEATSNEA